jgi:hypothetical protein
VTMDLPLWSNWQGLLVDSALEMSGQTSLWRAEGKNCLSGSRTKKCLSGRCIISPTRMIAGNLYSAPWRQTYFWRCSQKNMVISPGSIRSTVSTFFRSFGIDISQTPTTSIDLHECPRSQIS